jgi:hypothetical protein
MKPESRPSSEQGLDSAVNLAALITNSPRHPLGKQASFSGSLVAEVSSLSHLKRMFDNAELPTTKPRDSELQEITKEVVGVHVLLTGSLFGDDILRRLLLRVSLGKSTSVPLRF